jgi:hypothetical protein
MKRNYSSTMVFVDLSFNILIGFIVLFSLAFLSMQQKKEQDAKIASKAEFIITMEWPPEYNDDVDVYVQDPVGNLVFFRRREQGLMHLDRDDLGHRSDTITLADGTKYTVNENKEVVTIRGIVPGEYIVNAHMYFKNSIGPCPVKFKLEKLNPRVVTVAARDIELSEVGQERTAFRFTLDDQGNVTEINQIEAALAGSSIGTNTHSFEGEEYD